jgi:hypothetical protein
MRFDRLVPFRSFPSTGNLDGALILQTSQFENCPHGPWLVVTLSLGDAGRPRASRSLILDRRTELNGAAVRSQVVLLLRPSSEVTNAGRTWTCGVSNFNSRAAHSPSSLSGLEVCDRLKFQSQAEL